MDETLDDRLVIVNLDALRELNIRYGNIKVVRKEENILITEQKREIGSERKFSLIKDSREKVFIKGYYRGGSFLLMEINNLSRDPQNTSLLMKLYSELETYFRSIGLEAINSYVRPDLKRLAMRHGFKVKRRSLLTYLWDNYVNTSLRGCVYMRKDLRS